MEIIDPFYLYLILQLDSIKSFLGGTAIEFLLTISIITAAGLTIFRSAILSVTMTEDHHRVEAMLTNVVRQCKRIVAVCITALTLNAFLPTSERMAVIAMLPAIANNQSVQTEAKELYDLAKRGLTKLVDEPSPPAPATENN